MKTNKIFMFFFIAISLVICESTLFSQDASQTSNHNMVKNEVSINYIKRSIPPKEGNSNGLDKDGNNFIGIGWTNNIILGNDNYAISISKGFQFGNISGAFAFDIYFKPSFIFKQKYYEILVSSGITILSSNNKFWKYGGVGLNPELGLNINIYKNIKFHFNFGSEIYPYISYFIVGTGINYSL